MPKQVGRDGGPLLGGVARRRALHRASGGGAAAVLHLWGESVQHLWLMAEDRTWPAQRACSCVRVVAIRCCCAPTATAVSCTAAGPARSRAGMSGGERARSATRAARPVGSSTLLEARAGANGGVHSAGLAQEPSSIK